MKGLMRRVSDILCDFLHCHAILMRFHQLEQISAETNCWMFVAAQHPNGILPFINYTSPRLRKDAKGDAQQLVNEFQVLISGLIHARRKDALELGKTLAKANEENARVELKLGAVREAMQKQESEWASKDLEIAEYKARLGMKE
jgi:hypothetical protein